MQDKAPAKKTKKRKPKLRSPLPGSLKTSLTSLAFRNPLYNLTLKSPPPVALLSLPSDPWPGDAVRGRALLAHAYPFAGVVITSETAPWLPPGASNEFISVLHGFEWLRDLRAVGGDAARRQARHLVGDWIRQFGVWHPEAWRPDVLGARLASWITFHDFFCASADDRYRVAIFDSLGRQARHLARTLARATGEAELIIAIRGLIQSGISLPGGEMRTELGLRLLNRELARQILADGCHASRSPAIHINVLRHLIDIRGALRVARHKVPDALQTAIERMTPMLRFFRHGDGGLALFNDSQAGDPVVIEAVLTQADARGRAHRSAPYAGYERLAQGRTVVLVDVGAPPPPGFDRHAHAGLLAFEMSVGRERLIVNCGAHIAPGEWRNALRGTAAHSTLVLDELNAIDLVADGGISPRLLETDSDRYDSDDALLVDAGHGGYRLPLGIIHRRKLFLSDHGDELKGEERMIGGPGHAFTIRFHLAPSTQCVGVQSGKAALLRLGDGSGWRLRVGGAILAFENSIYCPDGLNPRRSQQVVLTGLTEDGETLVKWSLKREKKG